MSPDEAPRTLRGRLEAALGAASVRDGDAGHDGVDGRVPTLVGRPATEAQVGRVLEIAGRGGVTVLPTGSGSRRVIGNAPRSADLLLELGDLDAIHEFEARDQFLVAGAGARLAAVEERARAHGLTLAADFPLPGPGTLGGAVACGASGLSRLAARGARHAVIGMRVAHPDGAVTAHGTRVPKNVAGLDLCRLHVGALGTLGVITELTLRLRACPPAERTVLIPPRPVHDAIAEAVALVTDGLLPEVVLLDQERTAGPGGQATLSVRFQGETERVKWQAARTVERSKGTVLDGAESEAHWAKRSVALAPGSSPEALVLEIRCLPDRLAAALDAVHRAAPGLERSVVAHGASGEARVHLSDGGAPDELTTTRVVMDLRRALLEHRGSLRVLAAPTASKAGIDVWPDPGDALALMRRVKQSFDPGRVLNPGRFVLGI